MRKYTVPTYFELGGREWTVVTRRMDLDVNGSCSSDRREISLNEDLTEFEMIDTFHHELVHAIKYTLGWEDNESNHEECDSLGGMLLQFHRTCR